MKAFDKLPEEFQNDEVRRYYDILSKKQASVIFKRAFDLFVHVQTGESDEVRQAF